MARITENFKKSDTPKDYDFDPIISDYSSPLVSWPRKPRRRESEYPLESVRQIPESPVSNNSPKYIADGFIFKKPSRSSSLSDIKDMSRSKDRSPSPNGTRRSKIVSNSTYSAMRTKPNFPSSLPSFRKNGESIEQNSVEKPPKLKRLRQFRELTSTFKFDPNRGHKSSISEGNRKRSLESLALHSLSDNESEDELSLSKIPSRSNGNSLFGQYASAGSRPLPSRRLRQKEVFNLDMHKRDHALDSPWPEAFRDLHSLYPNIKAGILHDVLRKCGGDSFDAASMITDRGLAEKAELNESDSMQEENDEILTMNTPERLAAKSSKRNLSQPTKKIRDKYLKDSRDIIEIESSSEKPKRRRLINKGQIQTHKSFDLTGGDEATEHETEEEMKPKELEIAPRLKKQLYVLEFINTQPVSDLMDLGGCTEIVANEVVNRRPWESLDSLRESNIANGTNIQRSAVSRLVDTLEETLEGFRHVDELISRCELVGDSLMKDEMLIVGAISETDDKNNLDFTIPNQKISQAAIQKGEILVEQPKLLAEDVKLKVYQLAGVNWLSLLYRRGLSGILADEMGLGKTCQVIALFAHLLAKGQVGPHLIVVPSSTIENWIREIERFCPSLKYEVYYGSQDERYSIREELSRSKNFNVMITTYTLATGAKDDRKFLRSCNFDMCVYDEGHMLKNNESARYKHLMKLKAKRRLLLTGTPIQNNLRELMSLLSFILPQIFEGSQEILNDVFRIRGLELGRISEVTEFSMRRIERARKMMKPFVLRRKKVQVLADLPKKDHFIEYCKMTEPQARIYGYLKSKTEIALRSRELGLVLNQKDKAGNVIMQMRKAANHQMLFRQIYNDKILEEMATKLMNEPRYMQANRSYVVEDMTVMTDFELHKLCLEFPKSIGSYKCMPDCWMNSGKIEKLTEILPDLTKKGHRILLFSQFTQMLNILEDVLSELSINFLRMDGQTSVHSRQDIIDQFHEETDIPVFLLSTKAGGFGINLACADVVILYDLSFNPHDDKQAEDRAHRVGQTRDVKVIKLIMKGTIEVCLIYAI